jgi:hypothetical protein
MQRIIYLCPADNTPTGGIKVIYRHAEVLGALGARAFVLHPLDTAFRCTWFDHSAQFLDSLALDPHEDFVVIPELWAGAFGPQCREQGVRYALFVQNGYLTQPILPEQPAALMQAVYRGADLVLAISADTARMVLLNYPTIDPVRVVQVQTSLPARFLAPQSVSCGQAGVPSGDRMITFMPRKLAAHASRVVFALRQHLPSGWRVEPINNVDEATCAAMLFGSRIFLSFSEFEGLGLPPLEAALAGNLVIGYTGQGGGEYWDAPNFQEIHQGDVIGFVQATQQAAQLMDAGLLSREVLLPGIARLTDRFSAAAESASLRAMLTRIAACFAAAPRVPELV